MIKRDKIAFLQFLTVLGLIYELHFTRWVYKTKKLVTKNEVFYERFLQ